MQGGGGTNHHGGGAGTTETASSSVVGPVTSIAGLLWIGSSLVMDGLTAGLQKKIRSATVHCPPTTFDFLLLTNISMGVIAFIVSILLPTQAIIIEPNDNNTMTMDGAPIVYTTISTNDFMGGYYFLKYNPICLRMVIILCSCSVIGQSFIFYIIAQFDPFVCSTITTTRKVLSVLWSIIIKGHVLSSYGKLGILCAISGMILEIHGKATSSGTSSCSSSNDTVKSTKSKNSSLVHINNDKKRLSNNNSDDYHYYYHPIQQQYSSRQLHTNNNNNTTTKKISLWETFLQSTIKRRDDVTVNDTTSHQRNNNTTTNTKSNNKSRFFLTKRLLTMKSQK
jgi:UDP-galactose transporter B1